MQANRSMAISTAPGAQRAVFVSLSIEKRLLRLSQMQVFAISKPIDLGRESPIADPIDFAFTGQPRVISGPNRSGRTAPIDQLPVQRRIKVFAGFAKSQESAETLARKKWSTVTLHTSLCNSLQVPFS